MSETVKVTTIPKCDICSAEKNRSVPAIVDAKTKMGPWANMCATHFIHDGYYYPALGTGLGQRFILDIPASN